MKYAIASFLFLGLILTGCTTSQKIVGSWSDPDAKTMGPYKKAFVVVMSQNKDANYYIETKITQLLKAKGFQVVQCTDIFPPNFALTKDFTREQLKKALSDAGCDAVLSLALLDTKTVETYHPGYAYTPMSYGYYGNFYGYYNYYYPVIYTDDYYSVDKSYYLETNLYELASDKLIWSIQSEATNPKDLDEWFDKYAPLIMNHLKEKGLNQRK
jgi:hypothetical protein